VKRSIALAAMLSSLAFAATPTYAADETEAVETPTGFDVAIGVAFTSNYVSRGVTQTEDKPAIQGYVEASYGIGYIGVWASNTSFDDVWDPDMEVDFYGGIRPEFGDLSLDFGFAQYYYPDYPDEDYGELYAKASYAFTDMFSLGGEYYREVYNDANWAYLTTEIALPEEFTFSGKVGTDFENDGRIAWDAGVSRTFMDTATIDLRYYDSNMDPAKFVATLSFDLSLSSLMSGK